MSALFTLGKTNLFQLGEANNLKLTSHTRLLPATIEVQAMDVMNREGQAVVNATAGIKKIVLSFILWGTSKVDLETRVNNLKSKAIVKDDYLYFDNAGVPIYYRVYTTGFDVRERLDNDKVVEVTLEFTAFNPPYGISTIESTIYNNTNFTGDELNVTVMPGGTAAPKPKFRLEITTAGDINGIEITNKRTGKQIAVNSSFANGDIVIIDTEKLQVTRNGEPQRFDGVFPEFLPNGNDLSFYVYSDSGTTIGYSQTFTNAKKPFYGGIELSQGITLDSQTQLLARFAFPLEKVGNPGDITVRIETDASGSPSGTLVTNGEFTIPASEVYTDANWIYKTLANKPLPTPSTAYHIRLKAASSDEENYYNWLFTNNNLYAGGPAKRYFNGTWTTITNADFGFKAFKSFIDQNNDQVYSTYSTQSEFNNVAQKDAANSTGFWFNGLQYATMDKAASGEFTGETNNTPLNTTFTHDNSNGSLQQWTQGFVAERTGYITKVRQKISNVGSNPSSTVTIESYDHAESSTYQNDDGTISGGSGTSSTVAAGSLVAGTWQEWTFATPIKVYKGKRYGFRTSPSFNGYFSVYGNTSAWQTSLPGMAASGLRLCWETACLGQGANSLGFEIKYQNHDTTKNVLQSNNINYDWANTSTSTNYPGTGEDGGGGGTPWGNPGNIVSDNASYSHQTTSGAHFNFWNSLRAKNFGFAVNTNNIVREIYAEVQAKVSTSDIASYFPTTITLKLGSTVLASRTVVYPQGFNVGTSENTLIVGGDLEGYWGLDLPPATLNDATFAIEASFQVFDYAPVGDLQVDFIRCRVVTTTKLTANIVKAAVTLTDASSPTVQISSDGGATWGTVVNGNAFPPTVGNDLRFKITLDGTSTAAGRVGAIRIDSFTGQVLDSATKAISQQFTAGFTGSIGRIELNSKVLGTPGNLTVKIYTDNGSDRPGTLISTTTIAASNFPTTDFGWYVQDAGASTPVTNNTKYHMVLQAASASSGNYYAFRTNRGDVYTRGKLMTSTNSGSTYTETTGEDIQFRTYQTGGLPHAMNIKVTNRDRFQ
jgi:hypothetical protein